MALWQLSTTIGSGVRRIGRGWRTYVMFSQGKSSNRAFQSTAAKGVGGFNGLEALHRTLEAQVLLADRVEASASRADR